MNVVINNGTTANLNQTTSNTNTNAQNIGHDRLTPSIAISANDVECYAYNFGMASEQFCLLGQAMDLLHHHKDDWTSFEILCELIQQACYNMANNAERNKKDLLALLPTARQPNHNKPA
ncbi:hypothetical protein [Moraxella oculi]|uniref:Uncharacterized protein n=1 Tax=Moraxella oculi TaxID=2940516 RepID=A0ABW8U7P8_9GAMM